MVQRPSVEGAAFRLRPVALSDAGFIVGLRQASDRTRYLHRVGPDVAEQEAWLARYLGREGDYYFIIERKRTGEPEGTIGLYDVSPDGRTAEWGRWVIAEASPAALESAYLIYRFAFEGLGLDVVYCRTVADNARVVSFHDSMGLEMAGRLPAHFELDGVRHDAVEHQLTRAAWEALKPALETKVTRLAGKLGP